MLIDTSSTEMFSLQHSSLYALLTNVWVSGNLL